MKKPGSKCGKQPSTTARAGPVEGRRAFEWPLLIYPVLLLATLAILYTVNRSIERESPISPLPQHTGQEPAGTPSHVAPTGPAASHQPKLASGPTTPSPASAGASGAKGNPTPTPRGDKAASQPNRAASPAGKTRHAVDPSQLKGPAKTAALLCLAVEEKDHARIKQCLAELVAMGDQAVVPLKNVLADEQDDAALWAATALARIGTPAATGALLDRLAQTKEGSYKEELGKRVSSISNHDSWPLLLDTIVQTSDPTVVRAAGTSLSAMADTPVLDEVMARYETASTETEVDRLTQLVRNIRSPKATGSLLSLAGPPSFGPQDSLQDAAVEALAKIGDARSVSYLLRRLEASPPGQDTQIFNAITQIDSPDAQTSLLYAAAGNKEVSAEHGRTAAIYALKNYPDEKTVTLLERIMAQEQNEKVLTAAARTLDDIKRSPHVVTANADSLQKSEQMLPLEPLEK